MASILERLPPELIVRVFTFLPPRTRLLLESLGTVYYGASRVTMSSKYIERVLKEFLSRGVKKDKVKVLYLFAIKKYYLTRINFDLLETETFSTIYCEEMVVSLSEATKSNVIKEIKLSKDIQYIHAINMFFENNTNQRKVFKVKLQLPEKINVGTALETLVKYLPCLKNVTVDVLTENSRSHLLFSFWEAISQLVETVTFFHLGQSLDQLEFSLFDKSTSFTKVSSLFLAISNEDLLINKQIAKHFPSVEKLTVWTSELSLLVPFQYVQVLDLHISDEVTSLEEGVNDFLNKLGSKINTVSYSVDESISLLFWDKSLTKNACLDLVLREDLIDFPLFLQNLPPIETLTLEHWEPFTVKWLIDEHETISLVIINDFIVFKSLCECKKSIRSILPTSKSRKINFLLSKTCNDFRPFSFNENCFVTSIINI